jgi:hypothetical protein
MVICGYGTKGYVTHIESLLKVPLRLKSPTKDRDRYVRGEFIAL